MTVLQMAFVHGPLTTVLVFKQEFSTNPQRLSEANLAYSRDDAQGKLRFLMLNASQVSAPALYQIPGPSPTSYVAYILRTAYREPVVVPDLSDPMEYARRTGLALQTYLDPLFDPARFQVDQLAQVMEVASILRMSRVRDVLLPSSDTMTITEELLAYALQYRREVLAPSEPQTGGTPASSGGVTEFDKLAKNTKAAVIETVKETERRDAGAKRPPTRAENIEIEPPKEKPQVC
jgi:hypothetical protein